MVANDPMSNVKRPEQRKQRVQFVVDRRNLGSYADQDLTSVAVELQIIPGYHDSRPLRNNNYLQMEDPRLWTTFRQYFRDFSDLGRWNGNDQAVRCIKPLTPRGYMVQQG